MSDPVVPPGAPDIAVVVVTQQEKDTLYSQLQMLDPDKEGVSPNQLRAFYQKDGWNKIFAKLNGLVADGRVLRKLKGRPVALEYFTWQ